MGIDLHKSIQAKVDPRQYITISSSSNVKADLKSSTNVEKDASMLPDNDIEVEKIDDENIEFDDDNDNIDEQTWKELLDATDVNAAAGPSTSFSSSKFINENSNTKSKQSAPVDKGKKKKSSAKKSTEP